MESVTIEEIQQEIEDYIYKNKGVEISVNVLKNVVNGIFTEAIATTEIHKAVYIYNWIKLK